MSQASSHQPPAPRGRRPLRVGRGPVRGRGLAVHPRLARSPARGGGDLRALLDPRRRRLARQLRDPRPFGHRARPVIAGRHTGAVVARHTGLARHHAPAIPRCRCRRCRPVRSRGTMPPVRADGRQGRSPADEGDGPEQDQLPSQPPPPRGRAAQGRGHGPNRLALARELQDRRRRRQRTEQRRCARVPRRRIVGSHRSDQDALGGVRVEPDQSPGARADHRRSRLSKVTNPRFCSSSCGS